MVRIMFEFRTNYSNRPKYAGEENSGELITETAGFVSMKDRVENLMLAGQRLLTAREEQFDFKDGIDDGQPIPFDRDIGNDLADASNLLRASEENIKSRRNNSKKASKPEASETEEGEKDKVDEPATPVV